MAANCEFHCECDCCCHVRHRPVPHNTAWQKRITGSSRSRDLALGITASCRRNFQSASLAYNVFILNLADITIVPPLLAVYDSGVLTKALGVPIVALMVSLFDRAKTMIVPLLHLDDDRAEYDRASLLLQTAGDL